MGRVAARGRGASGLSANSHERTWRAPPSLATLDRASLVVLLLASSPAAATCVDPSKLAHSTVSITRHFDDKDRKRDPSLLGIRGTAWFLSSNSIVTVEHVAAAMDLSDRDWKQVEI